MDTLNKQKQAQAQQYANATKEEFAQQSVFQQKKQEGQVQKNEIKKELSSMFMQVTEQNLSGLADEPTDIDADIALLQSMPSFKNFSAEGELRKDKLKKGQPLTPSQEAAYIKERKDFIDSVQ